jgi:predicted small lipoprotein YifL
MKRSQIFAARPARASWRAVGSAVALAGLVTLAGCGSSAPLFSPDGSPTTLVQCANGSDLCEQQASAGCSGGYEVVRQTVEGGMRNLLYACKRK